MSAQKKYQLMLNAVFLVVFNLVFFLLGGFNRPVGVWVAYGFIHLAYILLLLTPRLIRNGFSAYLFGMTLYSVSTIYFNVVLVWGILSMLFFSDQSQLIIISQIIIGGCYAAILLTNLIANERTADAQIVHEKELQFVKICSQRLQAMLDLTTDPVTKKKAEHAYDLAHASQVKSADRVKTTENEILSNLDLLETAFSTADKGEITALLDKIIKGLEKRARDLKFT